ncbi:MAG: DUF3011 domain-containing protein [Deltaproteobacteria bacterium]|nr:DUF3011 domain-containing protein [Deltaproteobacteria bacterium]
MKKIQLLALAGATFLALPAVAHAESYVTCESENDVYQHCFVRGNRDIRSSRVEVVSRMSKTGCIQGYSWGVDRSGVWVDKGCRARFVIDPESRDYSSYRPYDDRERFDWDRERSDRYDRYDDHNRYGQYDRSDHSRRELEAERKRLEFERQQLELESQRMAREAEQTRLRTETCPPNSRPGRCSDAERRRGCKDWRVSPTLGCMSMR